MDDRVGKYSCILALLGISLISVIFLVWPVESATTYHNNILDTYPSGFSLLLYGTLALSLAIIAAGTYHEEWRTTAIGGLVYFLWMSIFYVLHDTRGYLFGTSGEDAMYHLGIIRSIIETGSLVEGEIYPASHALIGIIAIITDSPILNLDVMLSIPFRLTFLLGVALLGRRFWGSRGFAAVLLAATPFIFGRFVRTMHPFFYAFSLLPLILLVYDWTLRRDMDWTPLVVVSLIFISALVLLHPMTAIYVVVVLLSWHAGYYVSKMTGIGYPIKQLTNLPAFTAFFTGLWIVFQTTLLESSLGVILANFVSETEGIDTGGGESIINVFLTAFGESPASAGVLIYEVIVTEYGAALIYGGVGGYSRSGSATGFSTGRHNQSKPLLLSVM